MEIEKFAIPGLVLIRPSVFEDERGYFLESFNRRDFRQATGLDLNFVQDNESRSNKDVLRGLHFQVPPHAQDKLVRVVRGKVLDVAVDIRKGSPTYGKYQAVILSGENKAQFFVPKGFAHGFAVLEDETVFSYKCSEYYHKESEIALRWDDRDINIDWGIENPILSKKDRESALLLRTLEAHFEFHG